MSIWRKTVIFFLILLTFLFVSLHFLLSIKKADIENHLAHFSGFDLVFDKIDLDFNALIPRIRIAGLRASRGETKLEIGELYLTPSLIESLKQRTIHLSELAIRNLRLSLPFQIDRPLERSSNQTSIIKDLFDTWQNLSTKIDHFHLQNLELNLATTGGQPYQVKLGVMDLNKLKKNQKFSLNLKQGKLGQASLSGFWTINAQEELSFKGEIRANHFPLPLFHLDQNEFEKLKPKFDSLQCEDSNQFPCIHLENFKTFVDFTASKEKIDLKFDQTELRSGSLQADGLFGISSLPDGIHFNLELNKITGDLPHILSLLKKEWIGDATSEWLLKNLYKAKIKNGVVTLKSDSANADFEKFDITFQTSSPHLSFSEQWGELRDLAAKVTISQSELKILFSEGVYEGIPIRNSTFSMSFIEKELRAKIKGSLTSSLGQFLTALKKSPLQSGSLLTKQQLKLNSTAMVTMFVELEVPLTDKNKKGILLKSEVEIQDMQKRIFAVFSLNTKSLNYGFRATISDRKKPILSSSEVIEFDLKYAQGFIQVKGSPSTRFFTANFSKLNLSDFKEESISHSNSDEDTKPPNLLSPQNLPGFKVVIDNFSYNDLKLAKFNFSALKTSSGLDHFTAKIESPDLNVELKNGHWIKSEDEKDQSYFEGSLRSKNLGKFLKEMNFFAGLKAGDFQGQFNLTWPDLPWRGSLSNLKGSLNLKMTGGELLSTEGTFLKFVDILTLKRLNFNEKGSEIETVDGDLSFDNGKVGSDLLDVNLTSSRIKLKGNYKHQTKNIDTQVDMELKLGNAIAIGAVGVIAGPAAAILGYIIAENVTLPKLEFLNKLSAFSYRLEGPLDQPKISAFKSKTFGF